MNAQRNTTYRCKVCFDAGKPDTLYNSHFVRATPNKNSRVVCPTLLSTICRYCHKEGHTYSHCPRRLNDESGSISSDNSVTTVESNSSNPTKRMSKPTNVFSVLDSDSEDDTETIPSIETITYNHEKSSYLMAVLRPAPVISASEQAREVFRGCKFNRNWADYSDSDSDEE